MSEVLRLAGSALVRRVEVDGVVLRASAFTAPGDLSFIDFALRVPAELGMLYIIGNMAGARKDRRSAGGGRPPALPPPEAPRSYAIDIPKSVAKEIRDLPAPDQTRILDAIEALKVDPRPRWCDDVQGLKGVYRIDVRPYRILYTVFDDRVVVRVIRVRNRKEAYKDLAALLTRLKR